MMSTLSPAVPTYPVGLGAELAGSGRSEGMRPSMALNFKHLIQFSKRLTPGHSIPRREAARGVAWIFRPKRAWGNAGCPLHPRSRVHLVVVERTRATTSTPESPGIPARNGFNGFLRALPGDRACLPPSPADIASLRPVGPTCHPRT